jgi:phosphomannomutase
MGSFGFGANPPISFGTDGWRGKIADDFTFANVCKVTRAIAAYLETAYSRDRPVLIGYDTRFLAEQFAATAAAVLAELGWQVQISDRDCPTPALAYHARQLQSAGALMFTASHNPATDCGIKYIPDYAGPATTAITDAIVAHLSNASDALPQGIPTQRICQFDPQPDYLAFIYTQLDVERIRQARLRVTYDALYSTSRGYLDQALMHCGCTIATCHTQRDVLFAGGMPDPKGQQLAELVRLVPQERADLGLATDGDSDRFGVVDEQGQILAPNDVLLLLSRHLVQQKGKQGAIVRTVATTHLLDHLAAQYGLDLHETAVGFKHIGAKMRQIPVLIGGEESGGVSILGHIPEKDGILAGLLVVEAIAYAGQPLSQLVQAVITEVGGPLYNHRIDLRLSNGHKAALMTMFHQDPPTQIAGIKVAAIGHQDGIKLYLEDDSWVLLRPSGTEPLMRIYLETNSPAKVQQISEFMTAQVGNVRVKGASDLPDRAY